MTDITLSAAMRSNLVSLQSTADMIGQTQQRLSTGKKIASALDNPANFFAAKEHTDRAGLLSGLKDNISEAVQTLKTADNGLKGITTLISNLRGNLTQARGSLNATTSAADLAGVATQYNELVNQINTLRGDASYNGTNFLSATTTTLTVNFNEQATAKLNISGFDSSASGLAVASGSAAGAGTATSASFSSTALLDAAEATLNTALATLRTNASKLATNLSILTTRESFITDSINTLTDGAGKLTDADNNQEGANLLTLQTRQSLGTTSLSLASQAQAAILRLF